MTLNAIVKDDGTLIAKAPKSLKGKEVKIIVKEKDSKKTNWEAISAILEEADQLDIPKRNIKEILDDIHSFRESE